VLTFRLLFDTYSTFPDFWFSQLIKASLLQPNEALPNLQTLKGSKSSLFMGSTLFGFDHLASAEKDKEEKSGKDKEKTPTDETNRKLPIINPLVRLPNWPSKDRNKLLQYYCV